MIDGQHERHRTEPVGDPGHSPAAAPPRRVQVVAWVVILAMFGVPLLITLVQVLRP